MKNYHIGLIHRGKSFIFQYSQSKDGLDCEILEYFGQRLTTKKAAIFRLKDKETKNKTLSFLNNRYPGRNAKNIRIE